MKIADCMSRDVQTVSPDQPIREAAQQVEELSADDLLANGTIETRSR